MAPKPPVVVDLVWEGDLRFSVRPPLSAAADTSVPPLVLDSTGTAGPSPVTALAAALAGCMSIDVAHIIGRGRHPLRAMTAHLEGERSADQPHRLVALRLRFDICGDVPAAAVTRAIALSRDKYCSVWHSLRDDVDFQVTFAIGA